MSCVSCHMSLFLYKVSMLVGVAQPNEPIGQAGVLGLANMDIQLPGFSLMGISQPGCSRMESGETGL